MDVENSLPIFTEADELVVVPSEADVSDSESSSTNGQEGYTSPFPMIDNTPEQTYATEPEVTEATFPLIDNTPEQTYSSESDIRLKQISDES